MRAIIVALLIAGCAAPSTDSPTASEPPIEHFLPNDDVLDAEPTALQETWVIDPLGQARFMLDLHGNVTVAIAHPEIDNWNKASNLATELFGASDYVQMNFQPLESESRISGQGAYFIWTPTPYHPLSPTTNMPAGNKTIAANGTYILDVASSVTNFTIQIQAGKEKIRMPALPASKVQVIHLDETTAVTDTPNRVWHTSLDAPSATAIFQSWDYYADATSVNSATDTMSWNTKHQSASHARGPTTNTFVNSGSAYHVSKYFLAGELGSATFTRNWQAIGADIGSEHGATLYIFPVKFITPMEYP